MNPLNIVEIETQWGYRSFGLYEADITGLSHRVDLLAVSAFAGSYSPVEGTVISALRANCAIDMKDLFATRALDFRASLGSWVSRQLDNGPFGRIICLEMSGTSFPVPEAIENLFATIAVMEVKGIAVGSLALPVLGAGLQFLEPQPIIEAALKNGLSYLKRSAHLSRILFVEMNHERAAMFNEAMDLILGRERALIPPGYMMETVRSEILGNLIEADKRSLLRGSSLVEDIRHTVSQETSRSFEIGTVGRRLVERVSDELNPRPTIDLYKKIESLAEQGIAPWIVSYMHVLRVLGNEAAHEKSTQGRNPAAVESADVGLCLCCLQRVLDFYVHLER